MQDEDEDDDVISIQANDAGQIYVPSQLTDYSLRGDALDSMSVWSFFRDTLERVLTARDHDRLSGDSERQGMGQVRHPINLVFRRLLR